MQYLDAISISLTILNQSVTRLKKNKKTESESIGVS